MSVPVYLQSPYVFVLFAVGVVLATREVLVRQYLRAEVRPADDVRSFWVLWGATAVGTGVAVTVPLTGAGMVPVPALSFWVGIAVMLAGFLFRLYAIRTLGDLFSHRVVVMPDHDVVDAGPYRWVRHPSYTGAVVTYLGVGLACGNWASVLGALGGALVGYGYRIRIEEQTLRRELDGYEAYVNRTPYRLVPLVW